MLYLLHAWFNLLRYQTFRGICAVLTAFVLSLMMGPALIRWLKHVQKTGQPIRHDGPASHLITKQGTPTMGGLLILIAVSLTTLLWANLSNPYIWIAFLAMCGFALLGFLDDWQKLKHHSSKGVSARRKLAIQMTLALGLSALIMHNMGSAIFGTLCFPFVKWMCIHISYFYLLFSSLVVVGSSNAVNLTDGLDGLAIFPVMISSLSLASIAYVVGHSMFAQYLQIIHVPQVGEIVVFLGSWIGASLGFLWFNAPPAKVFMGDTGSLAAGAVLGTVAVMIKHEIVWALIGGVFVTEALSVMIQVGYYKMYRERVFLMAPIHHHFEQKGWSEPTIVIRFWIISVILALLGLVSLKIR